ncbi:uncharacterized protein J3D65DRAFT_602873 [Phyllosticta citribraziliensis]|uniref:Uncharacterized protein n=1 Tax=Phyllosticta citribraziliensis TaxID=989973 RepID=A0ABR1LNQ7_9PEZI
MRYSSLSSAMNNIYNFTPEDDHGLRDLLVQTAVAKIENENLLASQSFNDVLEAYGKFAKDIIHALHKATVVIWEIDLECKVCAQVATIPIKARVYDAKYWIWI